MTPFEDIYRLFLGSIKDYTLENKFKTNPDVAADILEVYLIKAIPCFTNCLKDLNNNIDLVLKCFTVKLDIDEMVILSDLMVLSWYENINNDLIDIKSILGDTDFKISNHYQSYKTALDSSNMHREKTYQKITDYGLKHSSDLDWWCF